MALHTCVSALSITEQLVLVAPNITSALCIIWQAIESGFAKGVPYIRASVYTRSCPVLALTIAHPGLVRDKHGWDNTLAFAVQDVI